MKPQLVVALDVPASDRIAPLVEALPEKVAWYKIGLELFAAEGPAALAPLRERGKQVFLDLKLHDIPRTVARTVASAAAHGIGLLTLHALGGRAMLRAAAGAAAAEPEAPRLVAVTTLTSLDREDLREIGVDRDLVEQTLALGRLAVESGMDGLVCSALEIAGFRRELGAAPLLVTPGIRPAGTAKGDQKRITTPATAVRAGSNFLVVGRPIVSARDPGAAAHAVLEEMRSARVAKGHPDAITDP